MRIRHCHADDLETLEWDGEFAHDRHLIDATFTRSTAGDMLMLVAEIESRLVGQIWIDFARTPDAGHLWALRVKEPWRGRRVGSRLLAAAERTCAARGCSAVELDVEPDNELARAMYERRGYRWRGFDPVTQRARLRKPL